MKKALLVAAGMMLVAFPAFSQSSDDSDDHSSSYSRRGGRNLDDLLRGMDSRASGGGSTRGAGFLVRVGDATLAVRCDARDSMRACVDAATTLLERARGVMPSGGATSAAPGAGPGAAPGAPPPR